MYRIGQSSDIHQLQVGRKLILGGIEVPSALGLVGHSDADVLVHAIGEAIIGALGLGDIGTHFPDTDPQYKNISSLILLEKINHIMKHEKYSIVNIDALIIIEEPKLKPYIQAMKECLANVLDIAQADINIKATRGEKLGYIGRLEGVMAQAVVLLKKEC